MAYVAGVIGFSFWPLRRQMRPVRWVIVVTLVSLHLIMKAPVWALIARADVVGGSSSYHRYELIDAFIRRFDEWWLLGTKHADAWGY
jgi:hypothetical protein